MKTLVLVGAGEFTEAMVDVDKHLLSLTFKKTPMVAIVPTAAGLEEDFYKWIDKGVRHFEKLGAVAKGIPARKREDMDDFGFIETIKKADLVYFSGGHPGYLHKSLVDTRLWEVVLERYQDGAILVGCSAGAMVMGDLVLSNAPELLFGDEEASFDKALGLIPGVIIPHFDQISEQAIGKIMSKLPSEARNSFLGLDEDTAIIVKNNKNAEVYGKRSVTVKKRKRNIYKKGQKFSLD